RDCARCTLKGDCLSKGRVNKAVVIGDDYPALVRARRRRARWSEDDRRMNEGASRSYRPRFVFLSLTPGVLAGLPECEFAPVRR
ncbi:MAG: hypothetical protein OXC28_15765, partial [Defluviicoccus sp.]|nr:hypothetical protein [Defluviicoccus sp.]